MEAPKASTSWATWAPARKDIVGASLGSARVWFTLAQGIVTECYYPRIDIPQIRDLGFIVADDDNFWVEVRKHGNYTIQVAHDYAPAITVIHRHDRFDLKLRICPDQDRDVLLVEYELSGDPVLRPYVLFSPRPGGETTATVGEATRHHGRQVLWAEQGPFGVALLAASGDTPDVFDRISAGCTGASDGWQDFDRNGRMSWEYDHAGPAEIGLMGELPRQATLALGFAASKESAATLAAESLCARFDDLWACHTESWAKWSETIREPRMPASLMKTFARSAMVLKAHGDRTYRGAVVASLAVPWGETNVSRGGYHLVWPRDLCETAGALIAIGAFDDARDVLRYLIATQQEDGHWLQNQWLGGKPFWEGVQLDETAFPVLLAGMLADAGELGAIPVTDMVRRALRFLARHGPATPQDRWEENAGINTFTLAICIAALVEGSQFLPDPGRTAALMLADTWNARLEDWTWVQGTPLAERLGVRGYYLRTAPSAVLVRKEAKTRHVQIKNRTFDNDLPANEVIATDFLQLVRYGLRSPDDPCILSSLRAMDALLRSETPAGPVWHRYNNDGYGEHSDGRPFDGAGRGRGWPLLTGERGHYALAAGEDPLPYLEAMARMAGPGGMIPEQVWDTAPMPERDLFPGRPTGSAMPLVWAHSEFIKLAVSRARRSIVDRPPMVWARYQGKRPEISWRGWTLHLHPRSIPAGVALRIAVPAPAIVHWGVNGWQDVTDTETRETGLGPYWLAELATSDLKPGDTVEFTFRWHDSRKWQGQDYQVEIET